MSEKDKRNYDDDYDYEATPSENVIFENSSIVENYDDAEPSKKAKSKVSDDNDFFATSMLSLDEAMTEYLHFRKHPEKQNTSYNKLIALVTKIERYNKSVLSSNKIKDNDVINQVSKAINDAIKNYDPSKNLEFSRYYVRVLVNKIMTYYSKNKDDKDKIRSCEQAIKIAAALMETQRHYMICRYLLSDRYKNADDLFSDTIGRCFYPEKTMKRNYGPTKRYNHEKVDQFYNWFVDKLKKCKEANKIAFERVNKRIIGNDEDIITATDTSNIEEITQVINDIKEIPCIYKSNVLKLKNAEKKWFRVFSSNIFIIICKAKFNRWHYINDIEKDAVNSMDPDLIDYVYVKESCRTFLEFEQISLKKYKDINLNDELGSGEIEIPFKQQLFLNYFKTQHPSFRGTTEPTYKKYKEWFRQMIKYDEILANFQH